MDKLIEALKTLMGHGDRAEVMKLMKEHAGALHHEIHQEGFNGGYGKGKGELDAEKGKVTELTGKLTKAEADLVEARKANPDVAKIHQDYQTQLRQKDDEYKASLKKGVDRTKAKGLEAAKKDLKARLQKLGAREVFADVEAERNVSRLVVDDEGELQVLQPGLDIPFAPIGEKQPLDLLAEAIRAKLTADMITSNVDTGSGDRPGNNGGLTGEAAVVKQIQDRAAKERENRTQGGGADGEGVPPALQRLAVKTR